jgi:hypothetical protein
MNRHWNKLSDTNQKMYLFGLGNEKTKSDCGHTDVKKPDGILKSTAICGSMAGYALGSNTYRGLRSIYNRVSKPMKAAALTAVLAFGAASYVADQYPAGQNPVAATMGTTFGGAVATTNFGGYNIVEDQLFLHIANILISVGVGATAGFLVRRGLNPLKLTIDESQLSTAQKKTLRAAVATGEAAGMAYLLPTFASAFGVEIEFQQAMVALTALNVAAQTIPQDKLEKLYKNCTDAWKVLSDKTGGAIQMTTFAPAEFVRKSAASVFGVFNSDHKNELLSDLREKYCSTAPSIDL